MESEEFDLRDIINFIQVHTQGLRPDPMSWLNDYMLLEDVLILLEKLGFKLTRGTLKK